MTESLESPITGLPNTEEAWHGIVPGQVFCPLAVACDRVLVGASGRLLSHVRQYPVTAR
jgi:hypothetical protein